MNPSDIAEMFVKAAETEAKLPEVKGLRVDFGRYALPWVHDRADIQGRGRVPGDRLEAGDDPLEQWRMEWFDQMARRAGQTEVSQWEACLKITAQFLTNPNDRRALWAWAMAQAGVLTLPASRKKISFARWCREVESIAEMTGHRRKNRALALIAAGSSGKPHLHGEICEKGVLPVTPDFEHIFATIEGGRAVYDTQRVHASSWRDDPAFQSTGMSLKEWRAAKRRERQAGRPEAA